ncbi:MAG: hypothetical protein WAK01_10675, partial [Methylocystis sp.]
MTASHLNKEAQSAQSQLQQKARHFLLAKPAQRTYAAALLATVFYVPGAQAQIATGTISTSPVTTNGTGVLSDSGGNPLNINSITLVGGGTISAPSGTIDLGSGSITGSLGVFTAMSVSSLTGNIASFSTVSATVVSANTVQG